MAWILTVLYISGCINYKHYLYHLNVQLYSSKTSKTLGRRSRTYLGYTHDHVVAEVHHLDSLCYVGHGLEALPAAVKDIRMILRLHPAAKVFPAG